jgi:fatty acyl-CoA reductase
MLHVQRKIAVGMDVLKFFTMSDWDFVSDNFYNLTKIQSKSEYDMFLVDTKDVGDTLQYLRTSLIGGRVFCAKEPLSNLKKAKLVIKM